MFRPAPLRIEYTTRDRVLLLEPLTWDDGDAVVVVPAGFVSDGASIPAPAWPFVGYPLAGAILRAALLHDYEIATRRAPSADVHRRFEIALRATGVGRARAAVLGAAVRLFGPRW